MKNVLYVVAFACAALVTDASWAAPPSQEDLEQKRERIEARMKRLRADVLRKDVGLDPAKAVMAERALERYAAERKKLHAELHRQRRVLHELLHSGSDDQAAYAKAVQELRAAQTKLYSLRDREFREVSQVMTPKQQARFLASLGRIRGKLRAALQSYRPAAD
jgi:hypothetical protein